MARSTSQKSLCVVRACRLVSNHYFSIFAVGCPFVFREREPNRKTPCRGSLRVPRFTGDTKRELSTTRCVFRRKILASLRYIFTELSLKRSWQAFTIITNSFCGEICVGNYLPEIEDKCHISRLLGAHAIVQKYVIENMI